MFHISITFTVFNKFQKAYRYTNVRNDNKEEYEIKYAQHAAFVITISISTIAKCISYWLHRITTFSTQLHTHTAVQ